MQGASSRLSAETARLESKRARIRMASRLLPTLLSDKRIYFILALRVINYRFFFFVINIIYYTWIILEIILFISLSELYIFSNKNFIFKM